MILEDLTSLRNLKHMLDYAAENFGERDFVLYKTPNGVEGKTYIDFQTFSDAFSLFLKDKGMSNAHVAIIGSTSFNWISAYFGTANIGGVAVPLAMAETDEMNAKLIEFSDTDVLVFDKKHKDLAKFVRESNPNVKLFVSIDNSAESEDVVNIGSIFETYKGKRLTVEPDGDQLCAIVFTSGTTGFPKGVMLTHKNFVMSATSVTKPCPTTRILCCLPLHHCFCFTANFTRSIVRGKTICINDNLANIFDDIRMYKPDGIIAVPQIVKKIMLTAIKYAEQHPEIPENEAVLSFLGGELIDIISGGAPLDAASNDRFNATGIYVLNGYGMTECAPVISNNVVGCFRHGSVGQPIPCMDIKLENGEILVKGANVMLGYYKNEEATKAAFTEDGWLHTGDLGHFDDDGFLYITGRCKNLILLDNGENVSAEMLEELVLAEPIVAETVCYGDDGAICAEVFLNQDYIIKNNITDVDKEMVGVLMRVNEKLATFQKISTYAIRDIPFERTSSQKIKRDGIANTKKAKREIVAPETKAEQRVYNAVCEILNKNNVSITDNFFAVGGNSLTATELAVTLNVSPQLIYDKPYLNMLASEIETAKKKAEQRDEKVNSLIAETSNSSDVEDFSCALLTGGTGFLGSHILRELTDRGVKVYVLVRDGENFKRQIEYYFDDIDLSNVHPINGDIESATLGLNKDLYDELVEKVDVVFHVAANVHHAGDYADLERTNVKGTENVIKFALRANAVMQHTSTLSVHGAGTVTQKYKDTYLDETLLNIGQNYWENVYIHSKYCAEEVVLNARKEQGLRANIYRIGNLTWRVSDGKFQKNLADNGFLSRIRAILKMGRITELSDKFPMDFTAVDECAKAYVNLAFTGKTNEIYHMYNPNFLPVRELFGLLNMPYSEVSTAQMVEEIVANSDDKDVHVYMFYLIISGRSSNVEMRNDFTVEYLSKTGFEWSKIDSRYLSLGEGKGICLDYPHFEKKPMRTTGGTLTPIQKLTLGVMRDAQLDEPLLFEGENTLDELYAHIQKQGLRKPLIVTFKGSRNIEKILEFVSKFEDFIVFDGFVGEPTLQNIEYALNLYISNNCDSVIAIGGGTALDAAKVIALWVANRTEKLDDICKIDSYANNAVPFFAIPTTAGTGSEVTVYSLITDEKENKKKTYICDKYLPTAVALNPHLTVGLSKNMTAATAIDALSHAVESYISLFADNFPEDRAQSLIAAKAIFENARIACDNPNNISARTALQKASYNAGLAFRRICTGYIHAVAHRFGEIYHIPHGHAIATAFTAILKAYLPYAQKELAELADYCDISDSRDSENVKAAKFIDAVDGLIADCGIDKNALPFNLADLKNIVLRAQDEAKLIGYPRPFSDSHLGEIIMDIFK
ncbi:MAG TPA: iron-containing alcohol dehydrogenase [Clostridiales bacterium]|nr:iron-containing alcohol dehydrogenase [Clostridiales bacterium]